MRASWTVDAVSALPEPKGLTVSNFRVLALRIGVSAALVLAALPAAGWKWGG